MPNIVYPASKLSRFISNPSIGYWRKLKGYSDIWDTLQIMCYVILVTRRYLKGIMMLIGYLAPRFN